MAAHRKMGLACASASCRILSPSSLARRAHSYAIAGVCPSSFPALPHLPTEVALASIVVWPQLFQGPASVAVDTSTRLILDTIFGVRGVPRPILRASVNFPTLHLCSWILCSGNARDSFVSPSIDSHVENGLVPSSGRGGSLENGKEGISCSPPFVDAAAIADQRGKHSMARVRQCSSIVDSFRVTLFSPKE